MLAGDALAELAREYILAEAVIERLSRLIDRAVLDALLRGAKLALDSEQAAAASAASISARLLEPGMTIEPRFDEKNEAWQLVVTRVVHGNQRVSVVDRDFVESGDFAQIRRTAGTLQGLLRAGVYVQRGEEKKPVQEFREAIDWLLEQARSGLSIQRYKGLGEMKPCAARCGPSSRISRRPSPARFAARWPTSTMRSRDVGAPGWRASAVSTGSSR